MALDNTHVGTVESQRDTYQRLTSEVAISKSVQWACFNKTPAMQAFGLEAFGVDSVRDINKFGAAKSSGRLIRYDSGKYAVAGQVFATGPTSSHVGRFGNFTPQLVEGGDEWKYSWHRLIQVEFIPDVDVQDNSAGTIDIKAHKVEGMKQAYVRDFNYCILGNASAPDAGTWGPSRVTNDLTNLISVTQTATCGAIAKTNTYWQNGYKAIADIGGGGELDRPLMLRRAMLDGLNDQQNYAEAANDYLLLATQGFFQIYDRIAYADSLTVGQRGAFGSVQRYDAAGIQHYGFSANPIVWDPAVTVPIGATAGTEACIGINIPHFWISIRSEENFKFSGWENPTEHDVQKSIIASIKTRYTPMVDAMRPHVVFYNIPACAD